MSEARPFPVWLRVLLNLLAIGGVGASVMGWVKPLVGCFVIFIALACIIHEGTASGCWEREDAGGSVILVAWPCC